MDADFEADALGQCWLASKKFDPEKSKENTYYWRVCFNLRVDKIRKGRSEMNALECIPNYSHFQDFELDELLLILTPRQASIILYTYYYGLGLRDISLILNMSVWRVRKILKRALECSNVFLISTE